MGRRSAKSDEKKRIAEFAERRTLENTAGAAGKPYVFSPILARPAGKGTRVRVAFMLARTLFAFGGSAI